MVRDLRVAPARKGPWRVCLARQRWCEVQLDGWQPDKPGYTQSYTREAKDCVEACGPYVEADLERRNDCITTNATDHKETGSKGGSGSGSGGTSKDGGESSARGMVAVTGQAGTMLVAWSLAWLLIWSL